jgi:WD40 repeat protein
MLPRTRTLLLAAGISGAMALFSSVAHAITITRAEVQWGDAVVMGRGAAANETINWEGFDVTTANKRGKFSFVSDVVPLGCEGTLSVTESTINIELDNCTPDSEEPEPEPIPELPLYREQKDAHNGDAVRAVGFVDDGAGGTWVTSGGEDAYVLSWSWPPDIPNLNLEHFEELDHIIYDLETSADGSIVATGEGGWNGGPGSDTLRIWNNSAFLVGTTAPIGFVYCVAISPGNQWTVASGFYGDIVVYRTSSLELYATKKTKKKRTKALAFSPDGAILASTSTAGRIQLWSFPEDCGSDSCELELLPVSMSHGGSWSFPIDFYPKLDATKIVSGSDGGMIKVWTIENLTAAPSVVSVLVVDSGAVYSLAWSPDGSMIVAGGNGDITVYDADTLKILFQTVNAHTSRVNDVAFSPDGSMIASGGADGALKLWDLGAP